MARFPSTTRRRRPPRRRGRVRPPAFAPHAHAALPDEPTTHDGRQVCSSCGKVGRPGDAQHPTDAPPFLPAVPDDAAALAARIIGERPPQTHDGAA